MGSAGAGGRIIAMFMVLFMVFIMIGWALGSFFVGDFTVANHLIPGWLFGMLLFLLFAALINGIGYLLSDRIILWAYRVKMVSESEAPRTYRIVRKVAERFNMRDGKGKFIDPVVDFGKKTQGNLIMPRVGIMPSETPNAFATGRNPKKSVVVVSQGILDLLSDEELEGVIAHEMAHIKDRDVLVMTVAATVAGAIAFAARWVLWSTILGGSRDRNVNPLLLFVVAITAPLAALLVQLAISRSREYKADRIGALTIEKPRLLASALGKLERENKKRPLGFGNPASASLFIVNPFSGGAFVRIFSTHPPIKDRIQRLNELEKEMKGQGPKVRVK